MRSFSSKSVSRTAWPASVLSMTMALKVVMVVLAKALRFCARRRAALKPVQNNSGKPFNLSGRHRGDARDRLLHDRHIDQRREHAEQDRQPPDHIIRAGAVEHDAAEPDAEKAADLVTETGEAGERRQP